MSDVHLVWFQNLPPQMRNDELARLLTVAREAAGASDDAWLWIESVGPKSGELCVAVEVPTVVPLAR